MPYFLQIVNLQTDYNLPSSSQHQYTVLLQNPSPVPATLLVLCSSHPPFRALALAVLWMPSVQLWGWLPQALGLCVIIPSQQGVSVQMAKSPYIIPSLFGSAYLVMRLQV